MLYKKCTLTGLAVKWETVNLSKLPECGKHTHAHICILSSSLLFSVVTDRTPDRQTVTRVIHLPLTSTHPLMLETIHTLPPFFLPSHKLNTPTLSMNPQDINIQFPIMPNIYNSITKHSKTHLWASTYGKRLL